MKVLVIGSGGREHALVWKIKQSSLVDQIFCAPGNGGIAQMAQCVDIKADDIAGLLNLAKEKQIDLTVVGPEVPLVLGIVDAFEEQGFKIFGPNQSAAQLEGSKSFAKEFMFENNIPTAPFRIFDNVDNAREFLDKVDYPIVIKADGLAAGKGVLICETKEAGQKALTDIMVDKIFGEAGNRVVMEEFLKGEETSILALSDGEHYCLLETSQDHKRIFDDDLGPNTGGMGAYSPALVVDKQLRKEIEATIIEPVIQGMRQKGIPFKGILYAGIILSEEGPMVLEFNVRFGDPEIQAILPRLKNDLVQMMLASCNHTMEQVRLEWDTRPCVCVVMSSGGYPGEYEKGLEITGLSEAAALDNTFVFHAGTKKDGDVIRTNGGRVLGVTSLGTNIEEAIACAYKAVEKIRFDRCFFRRDIGAKALKRIHV